jgi:hypothetical protein
MIFPLNIRSTVSGTGDSGLYKYVFLTPTGGQGGGSRFSLGGARGSQNYFNVDGISSNSPAFGNSIGPAEPSFESIQEVRFEIVNNKAEFGEVANITAITKSGTNDLHGALFWFHENSALNARPFFATSKGQNIRNNFGASAGGADQAQQAVFLRDVRRRAAAPAGDYHTECSHRRHEDRELLCPACASKSFRQRSALSRQHDPAEFVERGIGEMAIAFLSAAQFRTLPTPSTPTIAIRCRSRSGTINSISAWTMR